MAVWAGAAHCLISASFTMAGPRWRVLSHLIMFRDLKLTCHCKADWSCSLQCPCGENGNLVCLEKRKKIKFRFNLFFLKEAAEDHGQKVAFLCSFSQSMTD